jgi:hypothetical protein
VNRYTFRMEPVAFIAEYKFLFVIVHVLFVVLGMGSALVTDILCLRFGFNKKLSRFEVSTIRFLSNVVTLSLVGILLSGATVFLSDPERYLNSVKFLTKMTIVLVLCINGWLLHRYVFTHIGDKNILTDPRVRALRKIGFALGAVSLVSWVSALSLGVLLHISVSYDIAILVYLLTLLLAVILSQLIEARLLERKR